eukprot:g11420.t1
MPGATRTNSGNSDFDVAQLLAELSEESDGPSTKLKQSGATGPAAVHSEEDWESGRSWLRASKENSPSGSDSEVAAPSGQRAADQILLHPKEPQSESFVREEVHRLEAKMESSSGVNDALDAARLRHKTMLELEPEVEAADVADWPSERARRASALRHATLMDLDEVAEETLGSAPALTTPSVSESSRLGLPIMQPGAEASLHAQLQRSNLQEMRQSNARGERLVDPPQDSLRGLPTWKVPEPTLCRTPRSLGGESREGNCDCPSPSPLTIPFLVSQALRRRGSIFTGKGLSVRSRRPVVRQPPVGKDLPLDSVHSAISPGDVVLEERVGGDIVPPRFNANAAAVGGLASAMRQKVLLLREQVGALTAYCDRLESAAGLPSNAAGSLPMGPAHLAAMKAAAQQLAILHPSPRETEHLSAPGPSADGWSGVDEETRTRISSGLADWVGSPVRAHVPREGDAGHPGGPDQGAGPLVPWLLALMGTTTSCDAATSRPTLGCQADTVQACSQQCSKDSTRDVKSFHENTWHDTAPRPHRCDRMVRVRGSSWEPSQSKKQLQEAQRVVDQTLQLLGLGLMVEWQDEQKRLIISEDAKTLELHGEAHRPMRIPMSQAVRVRTTAMVVAKPVVHGAKRLHELDWLRALMVIMVVYAHISTSGIRGGVHGKLADDDRIYNMRDPSTLGVRWISMVRQYCLPLLLFVSGAASACSFRTSPGNFGKILLYTLMGVSLNAVLWLLGPQDPSCDPGSGYGRAECHGAVFDFTVCPFSGKIFPIVFQMWSIAWN